MKLTIIQTGQVPDQLRSTFMPYGRMIERMFGHAGADYQYDEVKVLAGEPFPDPASLEAIIFPGSSAGVYDEHFAWQKPLRQFIRGAYAAKTPMVGICFGHQVMADALGGVVRKSEKGWGLGRHTYEVKTRSPFGASALAIACSHQDQVIEAPGEAEVLLGSAFTPNAALAYRNGAALSFQPHPEFDDDYSLALAELRRGQTPDRVVDEAIASLSTPSDGHHVVAAIRDFYARQ